MGKFKDKFYSRIWYFDLKVLSFFYYNSEGRFAKPSKKSLGQNFIFIDPRCLREKGIFENNFIVWNKALLQRNWRSTLYINFFQIFIEGSVSVKSAINTKELISSNNKRSARMLAKTIRYPFISYTQNVINS